MFALKFAPFWFHFQVNVMNNNFPPNLTLMATIPGQCQSVDCPICGIQDRRECVLFSLKNTAAKDIKTTASYDSLHLLKITGKQNQYKANNSRSMESVEWDVKNTPKIWSVKSLSSGKAIVIFKLKTIILIEAFTNKGRYVFRLYHKKVPFMTSFAFPRLQKLVARTGQQNYEVHFVYDHKDEDSVWRNGV